MSTEINTQLLEEAAFYIDYFTNTGLGDVLERDVECFDLETLQFHLGFARKQAFEAEYQPEGVPA